MMEICKVYTVFLKRPQDTSFKSHYLTYYKYCRFILVLLKQLSFNLMEAGDLFIDKGGQTAVAFARICG